MTLPKRGLILEDIHRHERKHYKRGSFKRQIIAVEIPLFEKQTFLGLVVGWKVSAQKMEWQKSIDNFNELLSSSKKKKKVDYQALADCLAWSYSNQSVAVNSRQGNAVAWVVDMKSSFSDWL